MIPESVGAVIGFLTFIAPGVLWELLRERTRPPLEGSPFREAARVALMSVVLSGAAVLVLVVVSALSPSLLLDPEALIQNGDRYVDKEFARIAWSIGAAVGIACVLAWLPWRWPRLTNALVGKLTGQPPRSAVIHVMEPVIWSVLFGTAAGIPDQPKDSENLETHVLVRHVDGHFYRGKFLAVDYQLPRDNAYLALQPPLYVRRPCATTSAKMEPGYDRLVLPLSEIADFWVFQTERLSPRFREKQ
jgi:hypothetical protein